MTQLTFMLMALLSFKNVEISKTLPPNLIIESASVNCRTITITLNALSYSSFFATNGKTISVKYRKAGTNSWNTKILTQQGSYRRTFSITSANLITHGINMELQVSAPGATSALFPCITICIEKKEKDADNKNPN